MAANWLVPAKRIERKWRDTDSARNVNLTGHYRSKQCITDHLV